MRRWRAPALGVCLLFLLSACAQTVTKREAFPAMYEERPLSLLVLPPINQTTAADAKEFYGTTLAEPLSYAGYYIFPIEVVTEMVKQEGAYDTETLVNVAPQKFKEYFGADAVLYSWITHWDTAYYVIGGHVTVGVAFLLKSTTTGAELWKYDGVLQVSTGGGAGGGLAGLIVQVVVTAIQTATTDYVPIARQANLMVLSTLPYGRYHPMHGQDQDAVILPRKK
jgi:hypothetical protein